MFFCLWPCVLGFLVAVLLRWDKICFCVGEGLRLLAWTLWINTCWTLALPNPAGLNAPDDQESEVKLICKPTALAKYLREHCGLLGHCHLARWPRTDPHLQILYNLVCPTEQDEGVSFKRDNLLLQDGGIIALDWGVGLKDQKAQAEEYPPGGSVLGCHTSNPPIIIVIPNAFGKITQHVLSFCCLALQQAFYPVIFHRRGQGGCPLTTPRYQQFGDPSDLIQAVAYLRNRHPSSVLLAVSEGSGSGLLLSYLGECGSSSHLLAAACISPVLHGQKWFETPLLWPYHHAALLYRKLQLSRYETALSSVMDVEKILSCHSLQEMEKFMFCSVTEQGDSSEDIQDQWGDLRSSSSMKPDWDGYWKRNEPLRDADEVAVPVLCLCSNDDPLLPPVSNLPMSLFQNSPYFILALTTHGSHCGFLQETPRGITCWSHEAVLEYFCVSGNFFKMQDRTSVTGQGLRQRTSPVLPRRKRLGAFRRERPVLVPQRQVSMHPGLSFEEDQNTVTWKRSYTR